MSDTTYDDRPTPTSTAQRVATVLLMAGLAVAVPVAGMAGLLTSMASDSCGSSNVCNDGLIGLGVLISALSVAVAFLVALAVVIRRWRAGRTTWWVPLVALVGGAACWMLGALITSAGAG